MIALIVMFFIAVPYLYAFSANNDQVVFGGFLLNPLDGNTYLAKMRQGWDGAWRFRLPYTVESGKGGYLNLFYLYLGHMARVLKLPLLFTFHLARWLSAGILLRALWYFYGRIFQEISSRHIAFALAALGSGMGWLLIPTGQFTADFWVAETYPFLSANTNPHFPLGLAFLLWLIAPKEKKCSWRVHLCGAGAALLLSIVSPFGTALALTILGVQWLWKTIQELRVGQKVVFPVSIVAILLGGLPLLIYDWWLVHNDSVFAIWNAQNLTPSPVWWDVLISLSPALPFALLTLWRKKTEVKVTVPTLLLQWLVVGMILMYMPWNLQRRFMMGLYIPIAGLAAWALAQMGSNSARSYRFRVGGLFLLALPTNLMIIMISIFGIKTLDEKIYLNQSEAQALDWIEEWTIPDALILSGPEMGLWIPAHTGRRVIYGHPFETIYAEQEKQAVQRFFTGTMNSKDVQDFILSRSVDYILIGPREEALGDIDLPPTALPVYGSENLMIYQTGIAGP